MSLLSSRDRASRPFGVSLFFRPVLASALLVGGLWLTGCGGSSSSSGGGGGTSEGIALPSEISAVSASDTGGIRRGRAASQSPFSGMRISPAVGDLPENSDYNTVVVKKFVEIEVLDVFDIIEQIFDAVQQTHYDDIENVGAGWYKCMVAWEDEGEGGVTQKMMQEWYVNSTVSGGENRVRLKVVELDRGEQEIIRVQADITEAPTENPDGTLADLGVWEIRAVFGDNPDNFFHATGRVEENGLSRLTIQDNFEEEGVNGSTRAVVFRSADSGYGVVEYPDWDECFGPDPIDCSAGVPPVEVSFAYNADYLSIEIDGDSYSFDRGDEHEIVHRYKIFDGTDGSDIENDVDFGFPVRTQDGSFGWYGAWQDRHEVWANGSEELASGDTVTRDDLPPNQTAPTYTVDKFSGALTRVTLVQGSVDQLEGIPAEIYLWNNFRLVWSTDHWEQCIGDDGVGGCNSQSDFTSQLSSLATNGDGDQREVTIENCGQQGCTNYVYQTTGQAGFYEATFNEQSGRWESNGTILDEGALQDGFELFGWISGRTYIQYTGEFGGPTTTTGWVEKTLTSFDFETYTPVFDEESDREFIFEVGREYFVNNRGGNLRVTRTASNGDENDYEVYMEVQTVAKPSAGLSTLYPANTVLVDPWDPEASSTYALNTDTASQNYLLLEYNTVGSGDAGDNIQVGDVVTRDMWGLRIQGDNSNLADATLYNWEYREQGEYWGGVTYLVDSQGDYVLLSEPIRFEPIALARTDDVVNNRPENEWLSFSLMFDGHIHGLPDTWYELEKVDFAGDDIPSILANNVRIDDGTELTDASDGTTTYYIKAVDVGIFLGFVDSFPVGEEPDLTPTQTLDLDTELPSFTAPNVSASLPEGAELLYVAGKEVDSDDE